MLSAALRAHARTLGHRGVHSEALVVRGTPCEGVLELVLNRPKARNALSLSMMHALQTELASIARETSIKVVILSGNGPAFCSGHDLKELQHATQDEHENVFRTCAQLMQTLGALPQPTIAKVQGIATAAGVQLAATCDLVYSSTTARFATPGVNIGLFCSTPAVALGRAIQPKHAMEMLLTGDLYSAQTLLEWGLVNRLAEPGLVDEMVLQVARQIASKSRYVVTTGKETFYKQMEEGLDDAYVRCSRRMVDHLGGPSSRTGIEAFLTKKVPVWDD